MTVGDLIAKLQKLPAHYRIYFEGKVITVEVNRGNVAMLDRDPSGEVMAYGVGSRWVPLVEYVNPDLSEPIK